MMRDQLWCLLVDGRVDQDTRAYSNVYAFGSHLGEAYDIARKAATNELYQDLRLMEASMIDDPQDINGISDLVKLSDAVYTRLPKYMYPMKQDLHEFVPPLGIVKLIGEEDYAFELIREGYFKLPDKSPGHHELTLIVGRDRLAETFFNMMVSLPSIDDLWLLVTSYETNKYRELWALQKSPGALFVMDFLQMNQTDTLFNGFVDIIIYSKTGKTKLVLTSHKEILLISEDRKVIVQHCNMLEQWGFSQLGSLFCLQFGYQHRHYRTADSKSEERLKEMLARKGFFRVTIQELPI